MHSARLGLASAVAAVLLLAACGADDPTLMNIRSPDRGPDEFAILPSKPLQEPASFTALPPPTPGGSNLSDPTPEADAIAALGGRPGAAVRDGTIRAEPALVSHVSRFGTSANIRETLAAEDLQFRRRNDGRLLERMFNVNVYFRAYRRQSLDQYRELERFRALGVRTPAAPPPQPE